MVTAAPPLPVGKKVLTPYLIVQEAIK